MSRRQFLLQEGLLPLHADHHSVGHAKPVDHHTLGEPLTFDQVRQWLSPALLPARNTLRQFRGAIPSTRLGTRLSAWWQQWASRSRLVQALVVIVLLTILLSNLAFALVSSYFTRNLPPVDEIFTDGMFQTAMVYDRKGHLLDQIIDPNGGRRQVVTLQSIPRSLIDATVMTEDPSFFTNSGVDTIAIFRALLQNVRSGHIVSGASTITQQLVRNVLMSPDEQQAQTMQRKVGEAILAYRVTQRYTKEEILQRYLNEINYGNLAYGVSAASETYFAKPVQKLDLAEAALLAGLPQAPALFDPYQHPNAAKQRQLEVLTLMVKHGGISQAEADAAAQEPLHYHSLSTDVQAQHFVMDVRNFLEHRYTRAQIYQSGLRVYTSLDLTLQLQLERIVKSHSPALANDGANNTAVVVLDPKTGEILAMVGSADFSSDAIQGQINLATAHREPGTTLMPFTYLRAFDQHLATPTTILMDAPVQYSMGADKPPYQPQDADGKFRGPVPARRALADSLNVPAIGLLDRVGVEDLLTTFRRAGITSLSEPASYYGLSLTLGAAPVSLVELSRAYGVLARGGVLNGTSPNLNAGGPIETLKVTDAKGVALDTFSSTAGSQVASPQAAWQVTNVLANSDAHSRNFGANTPLNLPDRPAAVVEASPPSLRDAWVIGYTPGIVVGVWVGNTDGKPMNSTSAATEAATLWHEAIQEALNGQPVEEFTRPSGLVLATVDAATGLLPIPGQPTLTDWFIDGTVPTTPAPTPTPQPTIILVPAVSVPAAAAPAENVVRPAPPPKAAPQPQPPGHGKPKDKKR